MVAAVMSDQLPSSRDLEERVIRHFGAEVLDGHECEWRDRENGAPALWVDGGSVMFTLAGEDLHVTGPDDAGRVLCAAIAPDGTRRATVAAPDPFSGEQAAMN